jgi:membrane protein DedA with SNARE-associated domain
MDAILDAFVHALRLLPGPLDYVLVALIAFAETAVLLGLLVPGEISLVIAGILAARGALSLPALVAVATVGAIFGDLAGWFVGKRWGGGVLSRWRVTRRLFGRRMERTRAFFDRHGGKAVVLGRFIGGVRTFVPVAAGVARMPLRRFLAWDVVASAAWAAASLTVGYVFGPYIVAALKGTAAVVTGIVVALAVLWLVVRWMRRRPARPVAQEP